ncbi:TPM domain-containing protein [Ornithinimicrobium sp. Y1694]|uniref:TPM domain-containing protein n=1 Tax=Ornithinimicrobium sp. Y1694 TaxID=3418590 RepID=UPI003CE89A7C
MARRSGGSRGLTTRRGRTLPHGDPAPIPRIARIPRIALIIRMSLLLLAGALIAAILARPATAEQPLDLPTELVDGRGALEDTAALETLQDRLVRERGLQLFVVVVDDFGGHSAQEWAERTADLSDLGDQDLLLAVATQERSLELRVPSGTGLSPSTVSGLRSQAETELGQGQLDSAVLTVAEGLTDGPWSDPAGRSTRAALWGLGLGSAALLIGIGVMAWLMRSRRRAAEERALEEATMLARLYGAAAVATDQALDEAELEVSFAEAEFQPSLVDRLRDRLSAAREDSLRAHRLRSETASGPSDDLRWLVPATQARDQLGTALDLTTRSQKVLDGLGEELTDLRRQVDLVPDRLVALTAAADRSQLPADVTRTVTELLARARSALDSGRPEGAVLPLETVGIHLRSQAEQ